MVAGKEYLEDVLFRWGRGGEGSGPVGGDVDGGPVFRLCFLRGLGRSSLVLAAG